MFMRKCASFVSDLEFENHVSTASTSCADFTKGKLHETLKTPVVLPDDFPFLAFCLKDPFTDPIGIFPSIPATPPCKRLPHGCFWRLRIQSW